MISYRERCSKIGDRIKEERKTAKLTQETMLEKLLMSTKSTASVRKWENGEIIPDIDVLLRMSELFNCDMGYLLGDYDQRRRETADVCQVTGLSEYSVKLLSLEKNLGITGELANVIDVLLYDAGKRNIGTVNGKRYAYRSIINLLNFFFNYNGSSNKYSVSTHGVVYKDNSNDGSISANAIALNDRIVENATLEEIKQALINLKETHIITVSNEQEAHNGID